MPCFHPVQGWRAREINPDTGKRPIVFQRAKGFADLEVALPCGRCIGCRIERSREWALRCVHEASLHEDNCFLTLTYSDEHLPSDGSLNVAHFQTFMKRLRKKVGKVRYFHCGEYGEKENRPHYHALLFGVDFADKYLWQESNDNLLYRSETLEGLWKMGHSTIGAVTMQSAAYCARYALKKITGEKAPDHYGVRKPEYCTMSRNPGIGAEYVKKWRSDIFPCDHVEHEGALYKVPRFYEITLNDLEKRAIKGKRAQVARKHAHNSTPARLKVREKVLESKVKLLKRSV